MAVLRDRPYGNFNFLVDLGTGESDGPEAGFAEVTFPVATIETVEYRNGNEKENNNRKVTGVTKYTNLVLKRGVIGSLDLYDWWNQVRNGDAAAYRNVTVSLLSEDHSAVVMTWKFLRARPEAYTFTSLVDVDSRDVQYEILELAFERMEIE